MTSPRPTRLAAFLTTAGLSLLFIIVYGGCNWITAQRADVGIWHYDWERWIPFVPLMIVPYMSIDIFFFAAPFVCRSHAELRVLSLRIGFALLLAGLCFLLLPLTLAVPRPQSAGWTEPIYKFLHGFDQPHNLFPSLHITFRTIFASHYARHSKGAVRIAVHVWFILIGFSTLLTYQHHVADVAGGFVLAAICFHLFREDSVRKGGQPSYRIAGYYAAGAVAAICAAPAGWPWTSVLLWPALSFALTAAAYGWLGPSVYRKTNGRLPMSTQLLLAPSLIGQHLSLYYYRRKCAAWNQITPRVWISARLNRREAAEARRAGMTAVLDLTAEFSETATCRDLDYRNIPVLDLTAPDAEQLREALEFIARHSARGVVCVHCKAGYSRSAAVVGAYLLASGHAATVEQAVALLRNARPTIVIRPEARLALEAYAEIARQHACPID